jgi:hypothetical protein
VEEEEEEEEEEEKEKEEEEELTALKNRSWGGTGPSISET